MCCRCDEYSSSLYIQYKNKLVSLVICRCYDLWLNCRIASVDTEDAFWYSAQRTFFFRFVKVGVNNILCFSVSSCAFEGFAKCKYIN